MSKANPPYTPEPWERGAGGIISQGRFHWPGRKQRVGDSKIHCQIFTPGSASYIAHEAEGNIRRTVALINQAKGISTSRLERGALTDMRQALLDNYRLFHLLGINSQIVKDLRKLLLSIGVKAAELPK